MYSWNAFKTANVGAILITEQKKEPLRNLLSWETTCNHSKVELRCLCLADGGLPF